MRAILTAILYLHESREPLVPVRLAEALASLGGVVEAVVEPRERLVTVRYDHGRIGLGEIVRAVEIHGPPVSSLERRTTSCMTAVRRTPRDPIVGVLPASGRGWSVPLRA